MKTKTYDVYCQMNGKDKIFEISSHSLFKIIEDFVDNKGEILTISIRDNEDKKVLEFANEILKEKKNFYNSKYLCYYHLYRQDKITKDDFQKITEALKNLMTKSKNRTEYENKFNEYKKTLTI